MNPFHYSPHFCKGGVALTLMAGIFLSPITALAAPDFTTAEKRALLEYTRSCLTAQLAGAASPPLPPGFATRQQRNCFVTFFIGRRVFACFGGFVPRRGNLAAEISENIRLALKNDTRARTVNLQTAAEAGVQITFPLGQPQRVDGYQSIDPVREGMFVESPHGGVAFVPGEALTASWAFREALRRLGERNPAAVTVYRFKAEAVSTRGMNLKTH
ncbi:MAG: AMMECR1 domain-containing protein [Desulfuromonadales bacterium]